MLNKKINEIAKIGSKITGWFAMIGVTLMMLFITADVIVRYINEKGFLGSYEIVQLIFCTVVFSSFAYSEFERGHIHVFMLIRLFPAKLRFLLSSLGELIGVGMSCALCYAIVKQGIYLGEKGVTSMVLHIPFPPFYYICAVMCAMLVISFIFETTRNIIAMFDEEVAAEVQSNWV